MADNITAPATGALLATDECVINGVTVQVPRVKVSWGVDGTAVDASATNPLPVAFTGSLGVTGTFWQATQPISAASLPLPAGASTSALQTTMNTSLGLLATAAAQTAGNTKLDSVITLLGDTTTPAPITATALPLPTGASTETTLAAVNTKTPTQGQKVKTGSVPVTLASDHDPIDTVIKSTATSRSAIIGFVGTAAAATTASTTLTVTATTGVPIVGQTISGTGITAGTTITAVTGSAPYSLTLSAAATVASGAAVTSVGMQVLMAANTARRGMTIQNQSAAAKIWINGVGNAAADGSSLLIGPGLYYETSSVHTGTGAISIITDTPGTFIYAREF